jgi:hypothetical protein
VSPLAHVVQVAIVGGALVGVLVLFAGTATVDYLKAKARAASVDVCGWCGGGGCDECDPDRRYDPSAPDDAAEWDRARDRMLDAEAGVL